MGITLHAPSKLSLSRNKREGYYAGHFRRDNSGVWVQVAKHFRHLPDVVVLYHDSSWPESDVGLQLEESMQKLHIATEALKVYANTDNWKCDFNCIQNIWYEPDSHTPLMYAGNGTAVRALKEIK